MAKSVFPPGQWKYSQWQSPRVVTIVGISQLRSGHSMKIILHPPEKASQGGLRYLKDMAKLVFLMENYPCSCVLLK